MAKFLDLEGLNYFWDKIKSWVLERFAYKSDLNQKLDKLRSGQNIKTINGLDITGPGNIEIQGSSGGAVNSVNGKTGDVVLLANDVGALPNTTDIPTKVSDLTNDSSFSSVSINRKVSTGTNIADITIDGTTTLLYAPTSGGGGGASAFIAEYGVTPYADIKAAYDEDAIIICTVDDSGNTVVLQLAYFDDANDTFCFAQPVSEGSYWVSISSDDTWDDGYFQFASTDTATQLRDGLMSSADYVKLSNIEAGAEVNVQSDWNQTTTTAKDYIKNKPTIPDLSGYATTQDLEDSKVFWAEVDVTTFAEIKDAVDDGRTVMLKDANEYTYTLSTISDNYAAFVCVAVEDGMIILYNVYADDSYEEFNIILSDFESLTNKVKSISSSSDNNHYPTAKAVYDIVSTKYTKPSTGIPASDLASGVIPTVPVQDVTVGGTSVVSNGTAVIPQEVFWVTYGTTTYSQISTAVSSGKIVACLYSNRLYVLSVLNSTSARFAAYWDKSAYLIQVTNADVWSNEINSLQSAYDRVSSITGYETNTNRYPSTKAVADYAQTIANRVSTISGNETDETKYPNTKAVADALANYVLKSQTTGLLKNDGTVDTNTYLTQHQDISGKADKTLVASSMPSGGFLPNVVYNLGTLSGDTAFLMAAATDNTIANIWCWTFTTPPTAPTITWPAGIIGWSGGAAPTISASMHYEISVLNGIGVAMEV